MTLFLGIDGGGSGCRAAICDASGHVLGEGRAGPANIASNTDGARENILAAARAALPHGASLDDLVAVMGLAGANVAGCVARFREGLPFRKLRIETDAVIAAKGALGGRDGVVAAIGTGSVYAVQKDRAFRQIGGWGLVLGDEASGAWLGRTLLSRSLQAVDGLVPMTPLIETILSEHGSPDRIVAFASAARPSDFAVIARRVIASEDPAAQAVLGMADNFVIAAIDGLGASDVLPVVFLGGLGPTYAARLAGRWPQAGALGSALDGALLLARQDA
jgi:glucosamine kinase